MWTCRIKFHPAYLMSHKWCICSYPSPRYDNGGDAVTIVSAQQAAMELARSVIRTFTENQALEGKTTQITNSSIGAWNDILDTLRVKTLACGGGMLHLHEFDVVTGKNTRPIGVALFFIKRSNEKGYIGATWNEEERTCSIYGCQNDFPQVLKGLVERHEEKE